ncbi:MAG: chemotaxis protein CheX [Calditrichaeota bacterium]|nr:chemotaxis protein CheX [Calditrichota bacterium]
MNLTLLNPFVKGVFDCFQTMADLKPKQLAPYVTEDSKTMGDVTGIIGFTGKNIVGSVALSFPKDAIMNLYKAIMNEQINEVTPDLMDLTGELTNIIAGVAKKDLTEAGYSLQISIPTIIIGMDHTIHHRPPAETVIIPFQLNDSNFTLEVTLKTNGD